MAKLEYDYSLTPGAPNTDPNSQNKGKLTLKKVSFIHLGNTRGALSPYEFGYEDDRPAGDPQRREFNPAYKNGDHDRWNTYQPRPDPPSQPTPPAQPDLSIDAIPPLDDQLAATNQTGTDLDTWSSAWTLRRVTEPSGRIITVDYEANDYAYVQDKPAMRMFQIASVSVDPTASQNEICPVGVAQSVTFPVVGSLAVPCGSPGSPAAGSVAPRVSFTLDKPLPCSTTDECANSAAELKSRYVGANDQLFFKISCRAKGWLPSCGRKVANRLGLRANHKCRA